MDRDVLDRGLKAVLFEKAEEVEFAPAAGLRVLRRARRRIARNAAIAGIALAVAVYGIVGLTHALSAGEGVGPKPAQTPPTGILTPFGDSPIGDLEATVPVGESPTTVTLGEGAVWVLRPYGTVSRIDPGTNSLTQSQLEVSVMADLGVGFGSVWMVKPETAGPPPPPDARSTDAPQPGTAASPSAPSAGAAERLDPSTGRPVAFIEGVEDPVSLVLGEGSVWVASSSQSTVWRIDPVTNRIVAEIAIPNADILWNMVTVEGTVWVYMQDQQGDSDLVPIDTATNRVDESRIVDGLGIQSGLPLTGLVAGEGSLWLTECLPARPTCTWEVMRVDPKAGRAIARISVGTLKNGIVDAGDGTTRASVVAVEGGKVWVLANTGTYAPPESNGHAWILEIDPATNEVVSSKDVGDAYLYDAAFGDGAVWAVDIQSGQVLRFAYRT
jgi:DNA-binding beta-propeller fold protein YncE